MLILREYELEEKVVCVKPISLIIFPAMIAGTVRFLKMAPILHAHTLLLLLLYLTVIYIIIRGCGAGDHYLTTAPHLLLRLRYKSVWS